MLSELFLWVLQYLVEVVACQISDSFEKILGLMKFINFVVWL